MEQALASGNAAQIARTKETLESVVSSFAKQGNVLKVVGSDGAVAYINTTTDRVIVETDAHTYEVIAKQSYLYTAN